MSTDRVADFESHHVQGYARAAHEQGKDGSFHASLITEILPNLWMGGCYHNVALGDSFKYVVSLYPWEQFVLSPGTDRVEVKLYDVGEMPDIEVITELADAVNICRAFGPTLVHCQAGLNRSGLITALALIRDGMDAHDAIRLLRDRRSPMVLCNDTFERWLLTQ